MPRLAISAGHIKHSIGLEKSSPPRGRARASNPSGPGYPISSPVVSAARTGLRRIAVGLAESGSAGVSRLRLNSIHRSPRMTSKLDDRSGAREEPTQRLKEWQDLVTRFRSRMTESGSFCPLFAAPFLGYSSPAWSRCRGSEDPSGSSSAPSVGSRLSFVPRRRETARARPLFVGGAVIIIVGDDDAIVPAGILSWCAVRV